MKEEERYVQEVMRNVYASGREQARLEADLRAHFAAAAEAGETPSTVFGRLGSPAQVAAAFMGSVSLYYEGFWRRTAAFLIDIALLIAITLPSAWLAIVLANRIPQAPSGFDYLIGGFLIVLTVSLISVVLSALVLYFPILEGRFGQTLGKRFLGICVRKESGLPIGFREAILRRLPFYFDFWPIDALFVLFTAKKQRAFDIVARTVVVKRRPEGH